MQKPTEEIAIERPQTFADNTDPYIIQTSRPLVIRQENPTIIGLHEIHFKLPRQYGLYGNSETRGVQLNRGIIQDLTIEENLAIRGLLSKELEGVTIGNAVIKLVNSRAIQAFLDQNRVQLAKLGLVFNV